MRLFNNKCAYCEWKPTGGSDWDVEHFRPKGRVAESEHHPGYYWLAYEWTNLYLACTHCNQYRKGKPLWNDPEELPAAGKADQFSLEDETTRVMSHHDDDDIEDEATLLLDPCHDDPEDYLGFRVNGEIFSLEDNPYGNESIRVFHLYRKGLRDLRRTTVETAKATLKALRFFQANGPYEAEKEFRSLLDSFQAADSQFAAAVRYVEREPDAFGIG